MNKKRLPLIVIFGKTNVGKSTLFNCLLEKRKALTSSIPGTTRDSNFGIINWRGKNFELVDTGGIMNFNEKIFFKKRGGEKIIGGESGINTKVQKQAVEFLKKADLILFLVDNKTGLLPQDKKLAKSLKINSANREKIILIANKVDSQNQAPNSAEFNKLGLGEPVLVSSATGMGTGDLLDLIVKKLKKKKITGKNDEKPAEENISVCILGKPNVGKSSLLNSLTGYEKVIVSEIPHTTREPQDTKIFYQGKPIILIDTAGISKKGQKNKGLQKFGIEKSLKILSKSDIVLLIIDINEEITHQDAKLVEKIINRGKSFVIVANKWDLIKIKNTKKYSEYIRYKLPFAAWAPIIFISALSGAKTKKIFDFILKINQSRQMEISDSQLNKFLSTIVKIHPPTKGRGGKKPRIYEFKQIETNPPEFITRIGSQENLHASYVNFIKNKLRNKYKIMGTPLKITVIKNKKVHGRREIGKNKAV